MSFFSTALQRAIERRRLNQSDLARESGISRSFISRIMSGESRDVSDQNLIAILKIFSADPTTQAELVAARCMDARVGPGADLVDIRVKTAAKSEKTEPNLAEPVHLSQETERAFAWLRSQCPVNPELERHLVGYAKLMGLK
jgi:transcriptional regulator with XRE-family HTH domain